MTLLSVKAFNGLKPLVKPRLLSDSDAQVAKNVRLVSGSIEPMRGTNTLKSLTTSNPKTIFRYGSSATETNYWLEFANDTDVMRSPIPNDSYDRLYWTDGINPPRYAPNSMILSGGTYPGAFYQLGIPAPSAPAITASTAAGTGVTPESRTYVWTYVSAYGEEGPPSDAAPVVSLDPAHSATVSGPGAPGGNYNITFKRLYRSSSVGSNAQWQLVPVTWSGHSTPTYDVPVAITSVTDSASQAELAEVLMTEGWVAPPADLKGLRMMANGAAVGFSGRTVYLSEPNMPHAWPHKYTIDFDIVGIAVYGQTVAVLTNAFPFLLQGADPAAMTPTKVEIPQACTSKRGIIETGDGVLYPSPDGYVSLGAGLDVITKNLLSRDQWQAYAPSSMDAYLYNGRIHIFYYNGTERGILIIDPTGQGAILTTCTYNQYTPMTAGYYDPSTDTLYVAQNSSIWRFDRGSTTMATWRSKLWRLPFPQNMSCAQVIAGSYPVVLRIYADGVQKLERNVTSDDIFTLPGGYRARDWEFELDTSGEVSEVNIATSIDEIKRV